MEYSDILKTISKIPAISGFERKLGEHILKIFEEYCDTVEIDSFYNVIGMKKGIGVKRKKILVSAHCDEIGLMVKSIDEKGFIRITNIGGVDSKILLAQEVIIHGRKDVYGVIGAKPPHLLKPEERKRAVKMDELAIDTGMSADKLRELVSIGDVISFKSEPVSLLGNKLSSKSLDNRCGVTALIGIMKELSRVQHEHDVYFSASSQEEVGLRGATIAAYKVQPDAAIVIDVCHGDIPDVPKDEVYNLGKGPAVAIGPNLSKRLTQKIISIAKDENIPVQYDVEPGDTGTEAWAVQVSRSGVPTSLISIPLRYMHNPYETVHLDDLKNCGRLVARFIHRAGPEMEEMLCFSKN